MKEVMKKVLMAGVLFGVVVFGLSQGANAADVWKVGFLTATTGYYGALGQDVKDAVDLEAAKINAEGGILGKKIEIIFEDTEGNPAKAALLAKKLIHQEKVIGVVGPLFTGCGNAVAPVCEDAKIPQIFTSPDKKIWKGKKYVFHVTPSSELDAEVIAAYVGEKLKLHRVALLNGPTQYDVHVADCVARNIKANPETELVAREKWGQDDKDMTPYLLNIRKSKPDAIVIGGSSFHPAVATRNMRDLKMDIPIFCTSGASNKRFLELGGPAVNGVYVTSRLVYGNPLPEEKDLFEAVQKKFNRDPSTFHANGWDALLLMSEAIKRGQGDPKKMRDALENLKNFKGSIGTFNMSPTDHNGLSTEAIVMLRIKNQNWALAD